MEKVQPPKTGLAGLKAHFKDDFISGFSVSLIALPLCLGIAIASGFPPLAGLITAIVGGIFASRFAGSFVTISGPAAGLIVISLGAIESLGGAGEATGYAGYAHALGAIVIAGLFVMLFGILKFGKLGDYFPAAAVHGMLAAIGIIIIIKQIFVAIGVTAPKGEIIEQAMHIPTAFKELNVYALVISLITLFILVTHQYLKIKAIKMIPAPMWVLLIIVPIAQYFGNEHLNFVKLPDHILGEGGIQFPSFEKITTSAFWIAVLGFALVSGIESLLSAKAVDSLDPYKRNANLDKDLIAMGGGSSLAATIGGLPMISEIVRSSANINNGGKTQWANFFHGVLLLIYVLVLAFAIQLIPLSALAAMLVFTGFRLAHPREFKHTAAIGMHELIVFVITIIGVIATDLLIGIGIGILVNYILVLINGAKIKNLFIISKASVDETLYLKGSLIFSNYLSLKKSIDKNIKNKKLTLDFAEVNFIDHSVMHHLENYRKVLKRQEVMLNYQNMDALIKTSRHELAARKTGIDSKISEIKLSKRQLEIFSLANEKNWIYNSKQDWNGVWDFYTITLRKKMIALENLLINNKNGLVFTSADITTQEGARTTTEFQYVTVLKISGLKPLPKFYMAEETLIDKLTNLISDDDINFESNPVFSSRYILKGEHVVEVRKVFNDVLLDFFEKNQNLFLISNGCDLLLRFDYKFLNKEMITLLHTRAEELVSILNSKHEN